MREETLSMLEALQEPVALVSLFGLAPPEKRFILNQLLGGFEAVSRSRFSQDGLWLWISPLQRIAPDGSTYKLLILETNDKDGYYESMDTRDIQLISWSILLSSMSIYDQTIIHIDHQGSEGIDAVPVLEGCSSLLLLLNKDLHMGLVEGDRIISPLEHLLGSLEGAPGMDEHRNKMRVFIRGFFSSIYSCTLAHPVIEKDDHGKLDQKTERPRPVSRDGLANLGTFVLERAMPRQVGNTVMTGFMLARLTHVFLHALMCPIPFYQQIKEEIVCLNAYGFAKETFILSFTDLNKIKKRCSDPIPYEFAGKDFMLLVMNSNKTFEEVVKDYLERGAVIVIEMFDSAVDANGSVCRALRRIYLQFLRSALEKEIVEDKEQEMQIGFPTDVKHVAHIGWDGPSVDSPSWMKEFKAPTEFQSAPLSSPGDREDPEMKWVSEDSRRGNRASHSSELPEMQKSSRRHSSTEGSNSNDSPRKKDSKSRQSRKHQSKDSSQNGLKSTGSPPKGGLPDIPKKSRRKKSKESVSGGGSSRSRSNRGGGTSANSNGTYISPFSDPGPDNESMSQAPNSHLSPIPSIDDEEDERRVNKTSKEF